MNLTEACFHNLVDATQENLENTFEDCGLDVDVENSAGVMTVRFENGKALIFSRQTSLLQLWLATPNGGFHFNYDKKRSLWQCDKGDELLSEMIQRLTKEHTGVELKFEEI